MLSSTLNTDKRLWLLGLLLGNFAGLLLLVSGNPVSRRFLETAFPYTAYGYYTADFVWMLGLCLGGLVFPALLTCLARRRYALWGLLPIVILVAWITAGSLVNHKLSSFFDPFWDFPLFILLCWAVSCGPVSLFRLLRQKYHPQTASAAYTPPSRRLWLLPALLLPLLTLVGLGWHNRAHPNTAQFTMSARLSADTVNVPLVKRGTRLLVKVNNSTEDEALFQLDTGTADVSWPRSLHLPGKMAGEYSQALDVLGGSARRRLVLLPQLQIGGYKITNLPSQMEDATNGLFTPPEQGNADPVLGNTAFVLTVLTVDYKHEMLTIRNPSYDFTKQRRKQGDRILEMGWQTSFPEGDWRHAFYGMPALRVAVNGAPIWCTLDTGWDGPEMGLTKGFVDQYPSVKRARRDRMSANATYSTAEVDRLHDLVLTAPCLWPPHTLLTLKVNAAITPTLPSDSPEGEAAIGLLLMERYRITIDYQRSRVLLEPYARPVAAQKQEKAGAGAKQ